MGPVNPTNTGYQFTLLGNTIDHSLKWAVALHDTDYGLVKDNFVFDAQGAGIVTEDGSEIGNDILSNYAVYLHGTHSDGFTQSDRGTGGVGFWYRRSGNNGRWQRGGRQHLCRVALRQLLQLGPVLLASARGVDKLVPGQGVSTLNNPAGIFEDNEAFGMTDQGLWAAYISGHNTTPNQPLMTFKNLTIWNVLRAGVTVYHTANTTFDGLLVLATPPRRTALTSAPRTERWRAV